MTKIICDAALWEKLLDLAEPMELCDESGHVLARSWRHSTSFALRSSTRQLYGVRECERAGPTRRPQFLRPWKAFEMRQAKIWT